MTSKLKDFLVVLHDPQKRATFRLVRQAVSPRSACVVADLLQRAEEEERGFARNHYRASLAYVAGK